MEGAKLVFLACLILWNQGCGSSTTICASIPHNYSINSVVYDNQKQELTVDGYSSSSFCAPIGVEPNNVSYNSFSILLSNMEISLITDLAQETIDNSQDLPPPLGNIERLFDGNFPSRCSRCTLAVETIDGSFQFAFSTFLDMPIGQPLEHYLMYLTIYSENEPVERFGVEYHRVEQIELMTQVID